MVAVTGAASVAASSSVRSTFTRTDAIRASDSSIEQVQTLVEATAALTTPVPVDEARPSIYELNPNPGLDIGSVLAAVTGSAETVDALVAATNNAAGAGVATAVAVQEATDDVPVVVYEGAGGSAPAADTPVPQPVSASVDDFPPTTPLQTATAVAAYKGAAGFTAGASASTSISVAA